CFAPPDTRRCTWSGAPTTWSPSISRRCSEGCCSTSSRRSTQSLPTAAPDAKVSLDERSSSVAGCQRALSLSVWTIPGHSPRLRAIISPSSALVSPCDGLHSYQGRAGHTVSDYCRFEYPQPRTGRAPQPEVWGSDHTRTPPTMPAELGTITTSSPS